VRGEGEVREESGGMRRREFERGKGSQEPEASRSDDKAREHPRREFKRG
jgi:hypothetical protein